MRCIKCSHEIQEEATFCPYCGEKIITEKNKLPVTGSRYSFPSSLGLSGGILNISDDKAEFLAKSGKNETIFFRDVKSVSISMGMLEFLLFNRTTKTFSLDKDIRDEVLSFVKTALEPYIAERKDTLLARGIYYSFLSNRGLDFGTLDIFSDKAEYTTSSGHVETILFKDVRTVNLFSGMLEFSLTDGTSRSFEVDHDICQEVLSFVNNGIQPYVLKRTAGFHASFGIDERIEFNEDRGVFHIIRQNGNVITEEYSSKDLITCQWTESSTPDKVLTRVLSGGMLILNHASTAAGTQDMSKADEKVRYAGVYLTIRTGQETTTELVRFGDFLLGLNKTSKKYDRYTAELSKFMEYLSSSCPWCELIMPNT